MWSWADTEALMSGLIREE